MSSSKLDRSGVFQSLKVESHQTQLTLTPDAVQVHKNGIEFRSVRPFAVWKEMTVEMVPSGESRKVHFNGVVVECTGNRHAGYLVSMVITSVSRQSQERLNHLADSQLA